MSTDLDDHLRTLFAELAEATPVATPSRFQPERPAYAEPAPDRTRRAKRLLLAGVAAVVIVIVGLVVTSLGHNTARVSTSAIPSTEPVLWLPDTSSGAISITDYQQTDEAQFEAGAVRAPDGTVFGITVGAHSGDSVPEWLDERQIGGHTVRIATVAGAPSVVLRDISLGCTSLGVVTAGEDRWSGDTTALLQGVAVVDGNVRLELPSGWTSLGLSPSRHQFGTSFDVMVDGGKQAVFMSQMPDAQVGFFLAYMETNPRPVDMGEMQGWTIESATKPGDATLVAEREGTAFFLAGHVPASQLIDIARALVRARQADWTTHKDPGTSNLSMAPAPAGCRVPSLEILSNP